LDSEAQRPRWLADALKKGAKLEDFAIGASGAAKKKGAAKRGRKAKK
jgi:hypothetical protein